MDTSYTSLTHRYLARVVLETISPIALGSGERDITTDALVATDTNGLPYLPGSSIAGVLRHLAEEVLGTEHVKRLFGYQQSNKGEGSRLIVTEGKLVDAHGKACDGLCATDGDDFLQQFLQLPIRQHVRINDQGVASDGGKFDQQIVFAGARFCFEIELLGDVEGLTDFNHLLSLLHQTKFCLGSCTRSGFGILKVVTLQTCSVDLSVNDEVKLYLQKSSNLALSGKWSGWHKAETHDTEENAEFISYVVELTPDNLFLFASGMGDEDADITPVCEPRVQWENDAEGHFSSSTHFIPATSLKGALAHRTAFHFNRLSGIFADDLKTGGDQRLPHNVGTTMLFGSEDTAHQLRGCLLLSDAWCETSKEQEQVLQHVAIDRFTGGAMAGALFAEKVSVRGKQPFRLTLWIDSKALAYNAKLIGHPGKEELVVQSFEAALQDLATRRLALGGASSRGHGLFSGTISKNGQPL